MHSHATDGGPRAFDSKATARALRLHLDNAHDERTSGLDFAHLAERHRKAHKNARLAEIEAAANLLADGLATAPPGVVESILSDDACPDDPDGQHHVGCGCDEAETPAAPGSWTVYLTDGNGTLYKAEHVDPRHMPAVGELYRLTIETPAGDLVEATKASLAASQAYLDAHTSSGTPGPDAPGEASGSAAVDAPPAPPSPEGARSRPAWRPAPSGATGSGEAS